MNAPRDVGADVVARALDALDEHMRLRVLGGVAAAPLGVQVALVGVVAADLVRHLVVDAHVDSRRVLDGEFRAVLERHGPVRVEAAVRVRGDDLGVDLGEDAPAVAEEVAIRHLDCWLVRPVPVGAEQQRAPVVGVGGDPEVGDLARALDRR